MADNERPATLEVKATAAVRQDHALVPADRVVPGDEVFYTLEIRNTGARPLPPPTVDFAIPEHMRYIANSAVGAGAEVSYSVDGGHTFDRPENLSVVPVGGECAPRHGSRLHAHPLAPQARPEANSMAFARFRAVVK